MRPARMARRVLYRASRTWGLVALAALAAGALLLNLGYLNHNAGFRTTERFIAMAIDGDTLRTGSRRLRILGIDAPESSQTCRDEHGREWACGREAHARLRALVGFGLIECKWSSTDRYGRPLATCSAGPVLDIGEAMVRAGYATSFMSFKYWMAELEARSEKRGIWRGTFEQPQDWRRRNRQSTG